MKYQKQANLGYYYITLDNCVKAERAIQKLSGRAPATLCVTDKNALIASLSTMVLASGRGIRPSPATLELVTEIGLPFVLDLGGENAGY